MKGRNTTKIGVRVSDELYNKLEERAQEKGLSLSDYLRECLAYIVNRSGNTLSPLGNIISPEDLKSLREKKSYNPETMNRTMDLPIYDPLIHKAGDRVRVFQFKRWKAAVVPELDEDGNPIGRS